jgi:hypothetical protein
MAGSGERGASGAGERRATGSSDRGASADVQREIEAEIRRRIVRHLDVAVGEVRFVERGWILKTSSGKLARAANRDKLAAERAAATETSAPAGAVASAECADRAPTTVTERSR